MKRQKSAETTAWLFTTLYLALCLQLVYSEGTGTDVRLIINPTAIAASVETTPTIKLTCSCFSASLSATSVVWRKNHIKIAQRELLSNSTRYTFSFDSNSGTADFTIRKPQTRDSGYYECRAVINGSQVTSLPANVTIAKKMLFNHYSVVRQLSVEVNCPVRNTIPSSSLVFWSRKGSEILSGGSYRHSNNRTIKIIRADYDIGGLYRCVVQTNKGLEDAQTTILVQGPPEAPLHLSGVSKTRNEDCRLLEWQRPKFDGNALIRSYNLTCTEHSSKKIVLAGCGSQSTRMTIAGLERGVHYDCNVQAINDFGCSDYSNLFGAYCPDGLATDDPNVNTQETARSQSWTSAFVTLSTVFSSEHVIAVNVTDKPQQEVVTIGLGEISSTQFLVVMVLAAVVTISFFGLVVFVWFRSCYRKTGNYTTQEKGHVSSCHHDCGTVRTDCVHKQVQVVSEIVRETATKLKATDV